MGLVANILVTTRRASPETETIPTTGRAKRGMRTTSRAKRGMRTTKRHKQER